MLEPLEAPLTDGEEPPEAPAWRRERPGPVASGKGSVGHSLVMVLELKKFQLKIQLGLNFYTKVSNNG